MENINKLSVLVPVYNEEYLVEESLRRLLILEDCQYLKKIQIVVVDDCSYDNTKEVLADFSQKIVRESKKFEWIFLQHEKNYGKGKAVRTALEKADGEVSVIHDADLEYYPKDIIKMVKLFIEEEADAVFGSRFATHEQRRIMMFNHQLGNKLLTFCCNLVSNLNLSDMESGYKAVRTSLLKTIPLRSNDFRIEPEITIKLAKRNAKIYEIPISYSPRTYQEGKKIIWKDGVKALWAILKFAFSDDIFTENEFQSKILLQLSRAKKFNLWLVEIIKPFVGQNVLEIGAGVGNIAKILMPRKKYYITDINKDFLSYHSLRKEASPYLSIEHLDINNIESLQGRKIFFDTIICLNIIEHIDDDLLAINNIASLLEKGGRAIVLAPRAQWAFGSLDEAVDHKRRYSKKELYDLAEKSFLNVEKIISFNRVGFLPWLINGKILRRKHFGRLQIIVLNIFTPIFKVIDKFLPWPSLSYIVILTKQ